MNRLTLATIVVIAAAAIAGISMMYMHQDTTSESSKLIQTTSTENPKVPVESIPTIAMRQQTPPSTTMDKPETVIKQGKTYTVTLSTTMGDIVIDLDTTGTPITANNFAFLTQKHFYDKTVFHRTIKGFMIQGGDPTGTGAGGPGYRFADEPFTGSYTKGTVAMANAGPNTNGSQFFIMHADYPLPPNYVIFGHVSKGLDVVDKIATAPTKTSASGENSSPITPVTITSATLAEN